MNPTTAAKNLEAAQAHPVPEATPAKGAPQASVAGLPLAELWMNQPRAVRIFDADLNVLADNEPKRTERFPVFHDSRGRVIDRPRGAALAEWPVEVVRRGKELAERIYRIGEQAGPKTVRVRAWRATPAAGSPSLIVEETESFKEKAFEGSLEFLDQESDRLVSQIARHIQAGDFGRDLRLSLSNPRLEGSREFAVCRQPGCRRHEHDHAELDRCWDDEHRDCERHDGESDPLAQMVRCNDCEVFRLACPDPLTRLIENFNRLILVLQVKSQEALQAQQQLQQADKLSMLGELLAGVAHQIKNPLCIIMGRIELLLLESEGLSREELVEDLECVHEQAARMRDLVTHLLGISRPALSEPKAQSVNEAIRESSGLVRRTLEEANIELETDLGQQLPRVYMDAIQVQQVLLNLIINARDAMPRGGRLKIVTERADDEAVVGLRVRVEDTGEGIAPEHREEIFEPFYTTKLERGGTGLGLAICRRIMKQHHGTIAATPRLAGGTVMTLWFPAAESFV